MSAAFAAVIAPLFALSDRSVEYICAGLLAGFLAWLNQRTANKVDAGNARTEVAIAKADVAAAESTKAAEVAADTRHVIDVVHKNTNSMAEALVTATADAKLREGFIAGSASERIAAEAPIPMKEPPNLPLTTPKADPQ